MLEVTDRRGAAASFTLDNTGFCEEKKATDPDSEVWTLKTGRQKLKLTVTSACC